MAAGRAQAPHALRGQRAVIFVTVGTTHFPFQRLLDALPSLPLGEVVVQHGSASPPRGVRHATPFMDFGDVLEHFHAADAVVTHAGVGTILCARRAGHVPIVVPRQRRYGELVDDHQAELTRALEERHAVVAVWDTDRLAAALHSVPRRGSGPPVPCSPLAGKVRTALVS